LSAIGVDVKNMLYIPLDTIEDIFESIESIIMNIRSSSKDRLVTIVVDSVAAATTKIEQDADYDKDGWATSKAIIMSKALRKITNLIGKERVILAFTNQLREKLGAMFGDKYTTSGGKALPFHASCRVRLKSMGKLKDSNDEIVGVKTEAQIVKNRFGPPFKKAEFNIYFDSGIDDYASWLEAMKKYKAITQGGAWYTIVVESTGEVIKFLSKDWAALIRTNDDLREHCKNVLEKHSISSYKPQEVIDSESLKLDDSDISEV
jgi:recombination protein RecA